MNSHSTQQKAYPTTLYRVVYEGSLAKIGVFILFAFLLMQPVASAFADEVVSVPTETAQATSVSDETEVAVPDEDEPEEMIPVAEETVEAEETTEQESEVHVEEPATESEDDGTNVPEPEAEADVSGEAATSTQSASSTAPGSEYSDDPLQQDDEADTGTDSSVDDEVLEDSDELSTADETADTTDEESAEEQASEETEHADVVVEHNAHEYAFDTTECASVGDGAFYCSNTEKLQEFKQDGVYAAPDAGGDLEIFVRLNGEERKITSNDADDGAPYYDALSKRIVWHTKHNDRYQIVSYSLEDEEETVLTHASYNNMEPVAYDDVTLWQAWINNNWEIMLYEDGEVTQLTDNTMHDVSPHMRKGYIVWQTQFADGWMVAVYDEKSGHIEYVESEDGAKVENPRFVLVYDSTNEAGDVQTVGYDFDNKESFTLNSIPVQLPEELPDPDQTGETVAIIQNKHSIKGVEIEDSQDPVPTGTGTTTASTTQSGALPTLDLTASSTPVAQAPQVHFDIVVPPFATSTESVDLSHISEVVIPQAPSSTAEVR